MSSEAQAPLSKHSPKGHIHPVSQMMTDIVRIFGRIGFEFAEGPEMESEYYNFDALNIPAWHPARDMWDTFWLKPPAGGFTGPRSPGERGPGENSSLPQRLLLRTHTSPVQVRYMESHKPPLAIIVPGKVYRHEATDATHEAQFYQLEGLMAGPGVTLANFKWVMEYFFSEFFQKNISVRLRPSAYFPFVEPAVEVDMTCVKCGGTGCTTCKTTGWIEIAGAGMVHPKVFECCGINPKETTGFAFGAGIDRLGLLKYGYDDIRLLYNGDLRLVNQC